MKVAMIGAIAFAVGLAGGTGIGMRGGSARVAGDSTKVHADSNGVVPDSGEAMHAVATGDPAAATAGDSTGGGTEPAAAPTLAPAPAGADTSFNAKQLADALGKLNAAEAAPLLARFSDDEIVATLKELGVTRAGPFVAKLPEPRSTRLSRRLLLELGAGGHE